MKRTLLLAALAAATTLLLTLRSLRTDDERVQANATDDDLPRYAATAPAGRTDRFAETAADRIRFGSPHDEAGNRKRDDTESRPGRGCVRTGLVDLAACETRLETPYGSFASKAETGPNRFAIRR